MDQVFPGFLLPRDGYRVFEIVDDGVGRGYVVFERFCEEFGGGARDFGGREGREEGGQLEWVSLRTEREEAHRRAKIAEDGFLFA